jgi:hypothetical protein
MSRLVPENHTLYEFGVFANWKEKKTNFHLHLE